MLLMASYFFSNFFMLSGSYWKKSDGTLKAVLFVFFLIWCSSFKMVSKNSLVTSCSLITQLHIYPGGSYLIYNDVDLDRLQSDQTNSRNLEYFSLLFCPEMFNFNGGLKVPSESTYMKMKVLFMAPT